MLGSLNDFFPITYSQIVSKKQNFIEQKSQSLQSEHIPKRQRYKSVLHYETMDKTSLLQKNNARRKSLPHNNHELMSWAFHANIQNENDEKKHWTENDALKKSDIKDKNRLLKAIVRTRELQNQSHIKTLFEKSVDRVLLGFSKIKTQPVNSCLPATCFKQKLMSASNKDSQCEKSSRRHSTQMPEQKLLELQKSIKWAKKHKKNYNSFYQQLGKSIQVVDKESAGKNNYQLQRQQMIKKQEYRRRKCRQNFLCHIQKRIKLYEAK